MVERKDIKQKSKKFLICKLLLYFIIFIGVGYALCIILGPLFSPMLFALCVVFVLVILVLPLSKLLGDEEKEIEKK